MGVPGGRRELAFSVNTSIKPVESAFCIYPPPVQCGVCPTRAWLSRCVCTTEGCERPCIFDVSHMTGLPRLCTIVYTIITNGPIDVNTNQMVLVCVTPNLDPSTSSGWLASGLRGQTNSPYWPQELTQLAAPNQFRPTSTSSTCMCTSAPVTGRRQHGSNCLIFPRGRRFRNTRIYAGSSLATGFTDFKALISPCRCSANDVNPIAV